MKASGPSLPATAQVARHQGEFLADLFSRMKIEPGCEILEDMKTFQYSHKGSLAYVGTDKPVMDLLVIGPLWGYGWAGVEEFRNLLSDFQQKSVAGCFGLVGNEIVWKGYQQGVMSVFLVLILFSFSFLLILGTGQGGVREGGVSPPTPPPCPRAKKKVKTQIVEQLTGLEKKIVQVLLK
ncbi:hypothetical protein BSKO_00494 [Bryopsis sp. KO-2023]|nr:hypothetical protein BSKO_00494 [Bryopsis sp. KO-2023]